MSYKQEFQSNNTDLQGLIDLANSLPEAENLDTELATQDDLIAQIAAALEGKTGASGGTSVETSTVNINTYYNSSDFWFTNENQELKQISLSEPMSITVIKGSIVCVVTLADYDIGTSGGIIGEFRLSDREDQMIIFNVSGNGTITIN